MRRYIYIYIYTYSTRRREIGEQRASRQREARPHPARRATGTRIETRSSGMSSLSKTCLLFVCVYWFVCLYVSDWLIVCLWLIKLPKDVSSATVPRSDRKVDETKMAFKPKNGGSHLVASPRLLKKAFPGTPFPVLTLTWKSWRREPTPVSGKLRASC